MSLREDLVEPREGSIHLVVPTSAEAVHRAALVVKHVAAAWLPEAKAEEVEMMVVEVGNNVVLHGVGRRGPHEVFSIAVSPGLDGVVVEFSDHGPPFDPTAAPVGTVEESLARGGGGLGLAIVRRLADQLAYERRGDRNVLRLVKRP